MLRQTDIHTNLLSSPEDTGYVLPGRASCSLRDRDNPGILSARTARWITVDQPKHKNDQNPSWDHASLTVNDITALRLRITLRAHGHLQQPNWPQGNGGEWLFWTPGRSGWNITISLIGQESTWCPCPAVDGPILGSTLKVLLQMHPAILGHQGQETFSWILWPLKFPLNLRLPRLLFQDRKQTNGSMEDHSDRALNQWLCSEGPSHDTVQGAVGDAEMKMAQPGPLRNSRSCGRVKNIRFDIRPGSRSSSPLAIVKHQ